MTELSWTFNGGASLEINEKLFEEFLLYTRKKQLAIQGQNIKFSDKKVDRLQILINENKELEQKIEDFNKFIKQHTDRKKQIWRIKIMNNSNCSKYIEAREKDIGKIVKKIENNEINIHELEDDLINSLICHYTRQICLKKKQINNIKEKIKKGEN